MVRSMCQAITIYHVKYGALHNCVLGISNRHDGHEHEQLLDNAQECVLINWCQYHAQLAIPLSHVQAVQKATSIAGRTPGKNWVA
jgi:hypothetical protein